MLDRSGRDVNLSMAQFLPPVLFCENKAMETGRTTSNNNLSSGPTDTLTTFKALMESSTESSVNDGEQCKDEEQEVFLTPQSESASAWKTLRPKERKRQRSFFLIGLEMIVQLDIEGIRTFFQTFFSLPDWMWKGFLGSPLSSTDLLLFAIYMFVLAPNSMQKLLVRHLLSDPTGALMVKTYLSYELFGILSPL